MQVKALQERNEELEQELQKRRAREERDIVLSPAGVRRLQVWLLPACFLLCVSCPALHVGMAMQGYLVFPSIPGLTLTYESSLPARTLGQLKTSHAGWMSVQDNGSHARP